MIIRLWPEILLFLKYTCASIIGLATSSLIFYITIHYLNIPAFIGNFVGDLAALILVFLLSWNNIFKGNKELRILKFTMSSVCKIFIIFLMSSFIGFCGSMIGRYDFIQTSLGEDLALTIIKIAAAPISLMLNYFITKYFIQSFQIKPN